MAKAETRVLNRWIYVIVGVILMFIAGIVHAWTIFQSPITAQYTEWNAASIGITYTIVMLCYFIGGVISGILQRKLKSRFIIWICGVLIVLGMVISSYASSIFILYIGFGILCGLGAGMAYNCLLSTVGKWFPDKQGLISGILLMGIGIGTFLIGRIYAAVTPSDGSEQWRTTFIIFGIVIVVIYIIGGFFVVKPPEGWQPEGHSENAAKNAESSSYEDIDTKTMLKRPAFWIFFAWSVLMSISGLMFTSQGAQMSAEAVPAMEAGTVATVVGLFNIANSVGRIFFGIVFDKLGRLIDMLMGGIIFIIGVILMILALGGHSPLMLTIAFIVSGFGYGTVTPTNSAFVSKYFGMTYYPSNFSIITMVLIFASFGSTISGALYDGTGSYYATCILVIIFIVVASVISFFIRKPKGAVDKK